MPVFAICKTGVMEKSKEEMDRAIVTQSSSEDSEKFANCTPEKKRKAKVFMEVILENFPHLCYANKIECYSAAVFLLNLADKTTAKALFDEMASVCAKAYTDSKITTVEFSEEWFDATFADGYFESKGILPLSFKCIERMLCKHFVLFQMSMLKNGLKCKKLDNMSILNISFQPELP